MTLSVSGLAARSVIAPRWGSEEGWTTRNPARWAGLSQPGPSARKSRRDSSAVESLQRRIAFPARERFEARRGRSDSAQGIALGKKTERPHRGGLKGRARKPYAGQPHGRIRCRNYVPGHLAAEKAQRPGARCQPGASRFARCQIQTGSTLLDIEDHR
jgi:hypothetical protein